MNMPRFTAEASLSKTSGHYRTSRHILNPSVQTVGSIWPAAREQVGEIIHVHGCPPGSIAVGEPPNITCVFIPPGGAGGGGKTCPLVGGRRVATRTTKAKGKAKAKAVKHLVSG
jgi:hypothetical protein